MLDLLDKFSFAILVDETFIAKRYTLKVISTSI